MAAYQIGIMTHVTCRLTAKCRDQLRNPMLGNRYLFFTVITVIFTIAARNNNPGLNDGLQSDVTSSSPQSLSHRSGIETRR